MDQRSRRTNNYWTDGKVDGDEVVLLTKGYDWLGIFDLAGFETLTRLQKQQKEWKDGRKRKSRSHSDQARNNPRSYPTTGDIDVGEAPWSQSYGRGNREDGRDARQEIRGVKLTRCRRLLNRVATGILSRKSRESHVS